MKRVLVTGGAGFIGSHTAVELFKAGFLPIIVDNFCNSERAVIGRLGELAGTAFPLYAIDCGDPVALDRVFREERNIDGVIHFAAHKAVGASVEQPLKYYDNNLGSLVKLLQVMQEHGVERFVFSSSCTVYGQPKELPVTESSPLQPAESPYGRTKQFSEEIINDTAVAGKLQAVTLRYFNPVGAHPSGLIGELPLGTPENLVPYITQTAVGLREHLTVFGNDYPTPDGTCIRDYIHVVDLAAAHVAALNWLGRQTRPSFNEVFNVGTGRGTSVLEAIRAFETASNQKLNYVIGPRRPGDVVETYARVDKARKELEWTARHSIVDAMRDAYNWQLALAKRPLES